MNVALWIQTCQKGSKPSITLVGGILQSTPRIFC